MASASAANTNSSLNSDARRRTRAGCGVSTRIAIEGYSQRKYRFSPLQRFERRARYFPLNEAAREITTLQFVAICKISNALKHSAFIKYVADSLAERINRQDHAAVSLLRW